MTLAAAATLRPTLSTVRWRRQDLADTVTLGLAVDDAVEAAPGQFNMLWSPGIGEVPISVSGIGRDGTIEHTIRAAGPTTRALAAVRQGEQVGVRGPFGHGWDLSDLAGRDLLIVAGGIGLAPLRPVVELAAAGQFVGSNSRPDAVRVLVGARQPDQLLFADQLRQRWAHLAPELTVDVGDRDWEGSVGVVTSLLPGALTRPGDTVALVCGPELMMTVVAKDLVAGGVRPERIQVSLERNMHCGTGHCGHCQIGSMFACVDGPVVTWAAGRPNLTVRER
jgi:NAD(P)H-flavin reductase